MRPRPPRAPPSRALLFIVLALIPFYVNDLLFLATDDAWQWLAVDYSAKTLVLLLLLLPAATRSIALAPETAPAKAPRTILYAGAALALILASYHFLRAWLDAFFPELVAFEYPRIEAYGLQWLDLTFGLALTAIAEELMFRKILWQWIRPRVANAVPAHLIPALLFGLAHWSHGLGSIAAAFVSGLVLMVLYLGTGRIAVAMAVHYAANFLLFYR